MRRVQNAAACFPPSSDWRAYEGHEYLIRARCYLAESNFVLAYNYANCARALLIGEKERRQVKQIFARCGENMLNEAELLLQHKDLDNAVARISAAAKLISSEENTRVQDLYLQCSRRYNEEGARLLQEEVLEKAVSHFSTAINILSSEEETQEKRHAQSGLLRCGHLFLEQAKRDLIENNHAYALHKIYSAWALVCTADAISHIYDLLQRCDPLRISWHERLRYERFREEVRRAVSQGKFQAHFEKGQKLLETEFAAGYRELCYAQQLDPDNHQLNELLLDLEGERPI